MAVGKKHAPKQIVSVLRQIKVAIVRCFRNTRAVQNVGRS